MKFQKISANLSRRVAVDPLLNSVYSKKNQNIISKYETLSIYFNTGINASSITTLTKKLLDMQSLSLAKSKSLVIPPKTPKRKRKRDDDEEEPDEFQELLKRIGSEITPEEEEGIPVFPISLYITTYGGELDQAFSLVDTIKSMVVPVHTICKGIVASAGTIISLAGDKRFISENSVMLIHELSSGTWGKFSYINSHYENVKQSMKHLTDYYVKNTKMSKDEVKEFLKKDIEWNARLCLKKGLVDEIV